MLDRIASILHLVENAVVRFFGKEGRTTESSPETKQMAVIQTLFNRPGAKAFHSSAFQTAMESAVHKFMAEPLVANDEATRTISLPVFTVLLAKFVKKEVERRSLEKNEKDHYRNVSEKAIVGHKIKAEDN